MESQPQHERAQAKQALRDTMRQKRTLVASEEAQAAAREAGRHLARVVARHRARTVALYASIGNELSADPAAAMLRHHGVALAYPRVAPGQRALTFCRVDDPTRLVPGSFGIPEPAHDADPIPLESIDVIVTPGMAFGLDGQRLGWGHGYYDATLARCPALRVGFGYSWQLLNSVPHDEHDQPVDVVITDVGVLLPRGQPDPHEPNMAR
jgi:5-formyltetrahydrofolate cyclo-ligase